MSKSLKDRMVRYVCSQLSNWQLNLPHLLQAEREKRWGWHEGRWGERVLILGMGELGQSVAGGLVAQGYAVDGWSRSAKQIPGVRSLTGDDDLLKGLRNCDYLVNLLPLTQATRGLLGQELWSQCERKPVIMNVGRGASLQEVDLIPALDGGKISGAILDVFETEPLPKDHEFWSRPDIWITPHIASISEPSDVVTLTLKNLERVRNAEAPLYPVDLSREY